MSKDFFFNTPIKYFSEDQINAVKGILILSVMVGHIRSLAGENLEIFQFVYNYHVIGFLLLPFLYPIKSLTMNQVSIWAFRFLIPFTLFFFLYATSNIFILGEVVSIPSVIKGYFIATPLMIDAVTGTEILWFLPHVFLVFITFSFIMAKFKSFWPLLGIALIAHVLVGFVNKIYVSNIPFTAINIFYLFFLGLALRFIILNLKEQGQKYAILFLIAFLALQTFSILNESVLGYTGFYIFDISTPFKLLIIDALILCAMLTFLYASYLPKLKLLKWCGEHSIIIFLVHQPFLFVSWKILEKAFGEPSHILNIYIYGCVSFLFALAFSTICILFITRLKRVQSFIFPRDKVDWQSSMKF